MSDYAKAREEKLRRNQEVLQSLGLAATPFLEQAFATSTHLPPRPATRQTKQPQPPKKRRRRSSSIHRAETPNVNTRRSAQAKLPPAPRLTIDTSSSSGSSNNSQSEDESDVDQSVTLRRSHSPILPSTTKQKPWSERDDSILLFFHFVKQYSIKRLAKKLFRLEEEVMQRIAKWNFEENLTRARNGICDIAPIQPCCLSPAHVWARSTGRNRVNGKFTSFHVLEFNALRREERAKWELEFAKQRAKYFRRVLEFKRTLPRALRQNLATYNLLFAFRTGKGKRNRAAMLMPEEGVEEVDYFARIAKPEAVALYHKSRVLKRG